MIFSNIHKNMKKYHFILDRTKRCYRKMYSALCVFYVDFRRNDPNCGILKTALRLF